MPNRDLILLETVKTHRARLTSAFVFGELAERRLANDNLKRLIGGLVLAAVLCAGCVGFSFVSSLLGGQAAAQRQRAGLGPATGPVFVADTFDRRVRDGWGTAERGGGWRVAGPAADYRVGAGAARVDLTDGERRDAYLPGQLQDRSDLTATLRRGAGPRAGTVTVAAVARRVSSSEDYRATLQLRRDGSVALALSRRADPVSPGQPREERLSSTVILLGPDADGTDSSAPPVTVRVQAVGTGTTVLRAKAWPADGSEPPDWTVTATDGTAALQRPGSVGVSAVRAGDRAPADLLVTDFVARVAP